MNITEKFFIECVKAGINDRQITEIPQGIDFKALYNLCISHSVSVIVFYAIIGIKDMLPQMFYNALKVSAEKHVMKDIQINADSEAVLNAFEMNGVKFMPLKGYRLKKLYPKTEMRYTADCDILIDVKQLKKVREVVKSLGLEIKRYDEHHDIVYFNSTKSVFELHKMLFVGDLGKYFGIGFEKAKVKSGYKYYYELSPEDFYMTFLAHSAYHFAEGGGVGIRHLTDIYIFRKKFNLDEEYLAKEFEKCGLRTFQLQFERLEKYFFEDGDADAFTLQLADYVISSTVLGNEDKKSASDISANNSKVKTMFRVIFPTVSNMQFSYPILKKAVWLLPIFYVVRWFRVIFKTPKRLSKMKHISSTTSTEVEEVRNIRLGLGINNLK